MWRVWWTASSPCCWFWRRRNRKLSLRVYVRSWWSFVRVSGPRSGCSCECFRCIVEMNPCSYVLIKLFVFSLSNLFHGMDENTQVRHTVYCSLIKVAATCNAIAFIPTDLDQVRTSESYHTSISFPAFKMHHKKFGWVLKSPAHISSHN